MAQRVYPPLGALVSVQSSTAPDPGNNGTVSISRIGVVRLSPTGASRTGTILQAGTTGGQEIWVINEHATHTISWATQATSNIAGESGGTFVLQPLTGQKFVWDSSTSLWYKAT